jgi:hypothetical protein
LSKGRKFDKSGHPVCRAEKTSGNPVQKQQQQQPFFGTVSRFPVSAFRIVYQLDLISGRGRFDLDGSVTELGRFWVIFEALGAFLENN